MTQAEQTNQTDIVFFQPNGSARIVQVRRPFLLLPVGGVASVQTSWPFILENDFPVGSPLYESYEPFIEQQNAITGGVVTVPQGQPNPPGTVVRIPAGYGTRGWMSDYLAAYPLGTDVVDQTVRPDLVFVMTYALVRDLNFALGKWVDL